MKWKTTLVLLGVTVGVGVYVSRYELKQPSSEEREQRAKHVLDLDPSAVTNIALDFPLTKSLTLTRTDAGWRLGPGKLRADESRILALLHQLSPLMAPRTLTGTTDHPLDLKGFGLDPAQGRLTLETAAGRPATTLLFGELTPVGGHRYLKLADRPEVHLIDPALFDDANQFPDAFRDPRLVRLTAPMIQTLTVRTPMARYTLARRDGTWHLTEPVDDLAEAKAADELATTLAAMRIKRFVDDHPQVELIPTWGLDQASVELAVQTGGGAPALAVFFGTPIAEDHTLVYAKRRDEAHVYGVAREDVERFAKTPEALRAAACFSLSVGHVVKLSIAKTGGGAWTIVKRDGQWTDAQDGTVLETAKVEELARALTAVSVTGFVASPAALSTYGLEPPQGALEVWHADASAPQRLLIGEVVPGSAERYIKLEPRQVIARAPASVIGWLGYTVAQLKPEPPSALEGTGAPAGPAAPP